MKIIYVHHAQRLKGNPPGNNDDITKLGVKDSKLTAKLIEHFQQTSTPIKAIYTSPFLRCAKTAKILNKKLNVPIFEDDRLNEKGYIKNESWTDLQTRVRASIFDIVNKYNENDTVVCVTSGVNVAAFISIANKQAVSENAAYIGIMSCSPLIFTITKNHFID